MLDHRGDFWKHMLEGRWGVGSGIYLLFSCITLGYIVDYHGVKWNIDNYLIFFLCCIKIIFYSDALHLFNWLFVTRQVLLTIPTFLLWECEEFFFLIDKLHIKKDCFVFRRYDSLVLLIREYSLQIILLTLHVIFVFIYNITSAPSGWLMITPWPQQ